MQYTVVIHLLYKGIYFRCVYRVIVIIAFVFNIIITAIIIIIIFRQLFYDGHQQLALNLASAIGCSAQPPPPSDKLFRLVSMAKQFVDEPDPKDKDSIIQVF